MSSKLNESLEVAWSVDVPVPSALDVLEEVSLVESDSCSEKVGPVSSNV